MTGKTIALVTPYYPPYGAGGAEYTTSLHAGILVNRGYRVIVITPDYGSCGDSIENGGVEVWRYPLQTLHGGGEQVPSQYLYGRAHQNQLRRFMRSRLSTEHVTFIHVQHTFSVVGALEAGQALGIKTLLHVRDTSLICALGANCLSVDGGSTVPDKCRLPQHVACAVSFSKRFKSAVLKPLSGVGVTFRYAKHLRIREAIKHIHGLAFASEGLRDLHRPLSDFPDINKSTVVYAPAVLRAPSLSEPKDLPTRVKDLVDSRIPYVLYVGKVSTGKGADTLFRAHKKMLRDLPDVRLVIAGNVHEGPWEFEETKTILLGYVSRSVLPSLYRFASLVVVPSTWPEPLGWAVLDAGRYRKPIVATRVGGIPEAIIDGETGFLVPPLAPLIMADRMRSLLVDKDLSRKLACRNQEFIMNKFGESAVGDQLDVLYSQ